MPSRAPSSILIPFAVAAAGIALFSAMDAVMKGLSLAIGVYNALFWRTLAGTRFGGAGFLAARIAWPGPEALRLHLLRGTLSSLMAVLFFWGLARVPLAQGIALAFIAPLIALYLAALHLGERIERRAVLASLLGFAGVLVIMAAQAEAKLGPDAFRGALAILASACLYAVNIILMRKQALVAGPVEIAFFISTVMTFWFALAAPWLAVLPAPRHWLPIGGAAGLAFASLMLLSWAYARAEAQHLAPVEYSGFVWAALFGLLFFAEPVRPLTLAGATLIVAGCILAARGRKEHVADVEAAL